MTMQDDAPYWEEAYELDPHEVSERLKAVAEAQRAAALGLTAVDPPEFPIGIFPSWLSAYTEALAADLRCPVDLTATVSLGVLSLIGNHHATTISSPSGWTEGVNLYLTVGLPPGSSKSPAFTRLTAPLRSYQQTLDQTFSTDLGEWKAKRARLVIDEQRAKRESMKKDSGTVEKELYSQAHLDLLDHDDAKPERVELWIGDTTPEAALDPLHAAGGRLGILAPEGTVFGTLERAVERNGGAGMNLDVYLAGFSGDEYIVHRRNRDEPLHIEEARLVMCVLTQPKPLRRILSDSEVVARGFADRFMVSLPTSTVGSRDFTVDRPVPPGLAETYEAMIASIVADHDLVGSRRLTFSDDAWRAFNQWRTELESVRMERYDGTGSFIEKLHQAVIRTSALLHVAHRHATDEVDIITVMDAIELGSYWLQMLLIAGADTQADELTLAAIALRRWATKRGPGPVTIRDIQRGGPLRRRGFSDAEQVAEVVELLAEHGLAEIDSLNLNPWWKGRKGNQATIEISPWVEDAA